jgi:transposase
VDYKPHPTQFYHKYSLKSLTRLREKLVKQRSYYEVQITNILDIIFPELKPAFDNKFSATLFFILNKYKIAEKIANMRDYNSIKNVSHGRFSYAKFLQIKELAKITVGECNSIFETELTSLLTLHSSIQNEIKDLEGEIEKIIKELDSPILSIKGIGIISCAGIVAEFGDISRFKNANAMIAFAGLEPSISQSGTESHTGKMVKHGSGHLRYHLMNVAEYVFLHEPIFTEYYYKKRSEGKCHRVVLSHIAKKLIRIIYKLETENIKFDSSKCN